MAGFNARQLQQIADDFRRDGFVHIPGVLDEGLVQDLRRRTDELLDDPDLATRECPNSHDQRYVQSHTSATGENIPFILRNTIDLDPLFLGMLEHESTLALAEAVVGPSARFCGQNVLRNQPGVAIDSWHVDDALFYPVPEDVERHDPRIQLPVLWLTVQIALSDIDEDAHGPTQYVPGSQNSGRRPGQDDTQTFDGKGPVSIFCKAGDIYLHNPQTWHRGAPNTSDRVRYLMQCQYAVDWAFRRFGWMNRVPVADEHLRSASDQLLKILGRPRP